MLARKRRSNIELMLARKRRSNIKIAGAEAL